MSLRDDVEPEPESVPCERDAAIFEERHQCTARILIAALTGGLVAGALIRWLPW